MNNIIGLPALKDNYIWIYPLTENKVIVIDPAESNIVIDYCKKNQVEVDCILITHHHADHINGALDISNAFNSPIFAPNEVPLPSITVDTLNQIERDHQVIKIIAIPGHTLGHVAYLINNHLFCGDTLFSGGCGRIFEGTPEMLFNSLNHLKQLPDETLVYAGHEYTLSNLKFGIKIDPDNVHIQNALLTIKSCTLPSSIEREKQINVFFYSNFTSLKQKYNFNSDLELFTFLRQTKDLN